MTVHPLHLGQVATNLHSLESITVHSPIQAVVTPKVLELLNENNRLNPSSFEHFRAKSISTITGAVLSISVAAGLVLGIYKFSQTALAASLFYSGEKSLTALAQKVFLKMTQSPTNLVASAGGTLAIGYVLTRPVVYEIIASFVGSFFGTVLGEGIFGFFKELNHDGYQWWYSKYRFTERSQTIQSNKETIVTILKKTYDEMAKDQAQLKGKAQILQNNLTVIEAIFEKHGIPHNKALEITLEFEGALASALAAK